MKLSSVSGSIYRIFGKSAENCVIIAQNYYFQKNKYAHVAFLIGPMKWYGKTSDLFSIFKRFSVLCIFSKVTVLLKAFCHQSISVGMSYKGEKLERTLVTDMWQEEVKCWLLEIELCLLATRCDYGELMDHWWSP